MFTQTFQIGAYMPSLSDEQSGKASDQIAVVDGENFIWNLRGVQSAFGVVEQTGTAVDTGRHPGCFDVANERIFCFNTGLFKLVSGVYVQQIAQAATQTHPTYDLEGYKWSYAYVGTRHWFCHPTFPQLFYYDEFDDVWGLFRDPCWTGPIYSITQADNSLIVLLEDVVVWSSFDRGDLFECEKYSDAGAQSLARVQYGQPFAVMPYNQAWLTFTSKGIMLSVQTTDQAQHPDLRSLIVGAPIRFHHRDISHELMPLGPTAICHMDTRSVIWLAPQGFYAFSPAQGGGFGSISQYASPMSVFYKETLIPRAVEQNARLDLFQLDYIAEVRWLAVSSLSDQLFYRRSHIYQPEIERWGSFNHDHLLLVGRAADIEVSEQRRTRRHLAAVGLDGRLVVYDAQSSAARAWVKFSPIRLQAPQELSERSLTSIQAVRIGCNEPPWFPSLARGLQSSWRVDRAQEVHASIFKAALLAGDGSTQITGDEAEYLTPFRRANNVNYFTCHVTGLNHSLFILALEPDEHFDIRHVEMDFFYAGEI